MSHVFPVARSLADALAPGAPGARTLAEAERLAGPRAVVHLATDWLTLSAEDADRLLSAAPGDGPQGHLQRYEDKAGQTALAVTWWKLTEPKKQSKAKGGPRAGPADHTDDLYFRQGRTKPKRVKTPDPNQLDFFGSDGET